MKQKILIVLGTLRLLGIHSTPVTLAAERVPTQGVDEATIQSVLNHLRQNSDQASGLTCYVGCRMKCTK